MGGVSLFSVPGIKDHPDQAGVLSMTRTRLVVLLVLAACVPLLVEHLFMYEMAIGTITHTSEPTRHVRPSPPPEIRLAQLAKYVVP